MYSFLEELYQKEDPRYENTLRQFSDVMKEFWKEYSEKREKNFAQQGYEDKGYGHCERIIANVGELLENYCEILFQLNKGTFKNGNDRDEKKIKKQFKEQFKNHLNPNLVLFITSAFLHDIGMCFPGIFKALSDVLEGSGDSPSHISKIIHDYHNYATFIVLLEMNSSDTLKEKTPYLDIIPDKFWYEDIMKLRDLNYLLTKIHNKYFSKYNNDSNGGIAITKEDFFIILGIICLRHQKIESHYVQSILRKFTPDRKETVDAFNKWYAFFDRAREWTDLAPDWFPKEIKHSNENMFIGPELISDNQEKNKLDLLLVEALLQYGDKTEITIARLMKSTEKDVKSMQPTEKGQKMTGLEKFWADTQWDNGKGYICTNMAQEVISSYARFRACRFIPLFLVKVVKNERTNPVSLDVMMHYFRFPKDKDVFSFIRYHNEKDFQELKFLDVIKFHLPILLSFFNYKGKSINKNPELEINLKRKEFTFPTIDNELVKNMTEDQKKGIAFIEQRLDRIGNKRPEELFPYTPQNREAIIEFSRSIKPKMDNKELFFKSSGLTIPPSFELMAILNLFQQEE